MQNSLDRLFAGLQESLRTIVAPAITDPYVAGQVASIAEIIGNLSTRVEWRSDQLLESVVRVRPILELAGRRGLREIPLTGSVLGEPAPTAASTNPELLAARDAHLFALREVQRRLESHPDDEIDAAVRAFLIWQVANEASLLRTGMFSAPKGTAEPGAPSASTTSTMGSVESL